MQTGDPQGIEAAYELRAEMLALEAEGRIRLTARGDRLGFVPLDDIGRQALAATP